MREQIIKEISNRLYELFYFNRNIYGIQLEDGSYRLIRDKVTPILIDKMLLDGTTLMVYQEVHTYRDAFLKWICFDLDIPKKSIEENEVNEASLAPVKRAADQLCKVLEQSNLNYLQEYLCKQACTMHLSN